METLLLNEGMIVHYVLPDGGQRPAIVVRVWRVQGKPQANGLCQLMQFTDGTNDQASHSEPMVPVRWRTSVAYDPSGKPGTWHWMHQVIPGIDG